jgi:hypothetical protein
MYINPQPYWGVSADIHIAEVFPSDRNLTVTVHRGKWVVTLYKAFIDTTTGGSHRRGLHDFI